MKSEGSTVEAGAGPRNTHPALEQDYRRCAEITRRSSSNFYYAFLLLPPRRRRALHAVYAFCRFIDDIADDESVREPAAMLARWRQELSRAYGGEPTRPVSRALSDAVRQFSIPRRYFEEIISGVEMDLGQKRYAAFDDLRLYCYRVASAVGLICIEIFGYTNPDARTYADRLGIAFQLTNILRDVKEDAERGRIYLPLEDLERFAVPEEEILHGVYSARFRKLMDFEARRAFDYYLQAESFIPPEDRSSLVTAEAMRLIYGALLEQIVRSDYRVLDRRIRLLTATKLFLVSRAWVGTRFGTERGSHDSDGR